MDLGRFAANTAIPATARRRPLVLAGAASLTLTGATLTPSFQAAPISVNIVWSLVFAVLAASAYGRRAGLLVGLAGVAPIPFLLWPNNGWANLVGAGQYLIWLWWQGWCGEWRVRAPRFWNYPPVAQLAMLPVHALVFLVLFPKFLALNPPPWDVVAVTEIPSGVLAGLMIKDTAGLYFCLLGAICLLKLPFIRRLFGLAIPCSHRLNTRVMGSVALAIAGLWLIVLALDSLLIRGDFPEGCLRLNSPYEIVSLFVLTTATLAAGLAICSYIERNLTAADNLQAAERSLRATLAQLQTTNAEMERFTTVAAHDLQEPVRTVVSFSQLLEQHFGDHLDATGREYLTYIVEGARRMKSLVAALLAFSRISNKPLRQEAVSTRDLLETVFESLRQQTANRPVALTIVHAPEVMGDREHLRQLFGHLLSNALKFHAPDGETRIRVDARRDPDALWEFSVADNGIGIAPEYHGTVFEAFRRLHPIGRFPGVGIGLALARHIVVEHGGRIWVASGEPGNTVIRFTLPATPES